MTKIYSFRGTVKRKSLKLSTWKSVRAWNRMDLYKEHTQICEKEPKRTLPLTDAGRVSLKRFKVSREYFQRWMTAFPIGDRAQRRAARDDVENTCMADAQRDTDPAGASSEEQMAGHIARYVQHYDVQTQPDWTTLVTEYPGVSLFVTECSPDSVQISYGGEFSTRAQLLVEVPYKYSDGFETEASMTVPAFVTGRLKRNGDIQIKEFRLSINKSG